jgi:hypothetical protein
VTAVKVTVTGAGGSPAYSCGCGTLNGNPGGTASVSSGTQSISTISATGGSGGVQNNNVDGGIGSGGNINLRGGAGTGSGAGVAGASFWGGGQRGGGGDTRGAGAVAAGAGGTAISWLTGLTPGNTITVTVPAAPSRGGFNGNPGIVVFEW